MFHRRRGGFRRSRARSHARRRIPRYGSTRGGIRL